MIPLTNYDYSEGEQWGRNIIYPDQCGCIHHIGCKQFWSGMPRRPWTQKIYAACPVLFFHGFQYNRRRLVYFIGHFNFHHVCWLKSLFLLFQNVPNTWRFQRVQHLEPIIYKNKTPSQYQYVVIHVLSVIYMSFSIHVILWFVNVKLKSSVFEPKTEISTLKDFDLADRNPHGWSIGNLKVMLVVKPVKFEIIWLYPFTTFVNFVKYWWHWW